MEIERDLSVRGYEITDTNGDESEVIFCHKGIPLNPLYKVGFGKRGFIVISCMDGDKRINRLLISDRLLKKLTVNSEEWDGMECPKEKCNTLTIEHRCDAW